MVDVEILGRGICQDLTCCLAFTGGGGSPNVIQVGRYGNPGDGW